MQFTLAGNAEIEFPFLEESGCTGPEGRKRDHSQTNAAASTGTGNCATK